MFRCYPWNKTCNAKIQFCVQNKPVSGQLHGGLMRLLDTAADVEIKVKFNLEYAMKDHRWSTGVVILFL